MADTTNLGTNQTTTTKKLIVKFDGSCTDTKRDGDLGIGINAYYEGDKEGSFFTIAESAGIGTNNEAEYKALIHAMRAVIKRGVTDNVEFTGDSEVVIKQMTGEYRCLEFFLLPLNKEAKSLTESFTNLSFKHVKREFNTLADDLSKEKVHKTLTNYYKYKF